MVYEVPTFSCRMYFQNNYYMSEVLIELPDGLPLILTCVMLHGGSPSPTDGFLHSRIVSFLSMKLRSSYFISDLTLSVCLSYGACILNVFSLVVVLIAS